MDYLYRVKLDGDDQAEMVLPEQNYVMLRQQQLISICLHLEYLFQARY